MQTINSHNPDILNCVANLSSDEVFTPPKLANKILDKLPENIWEDENIKFLDPVSKTGIFLREITKRLEKGLEKKIPDQKKRINHILKNQVYGIGVSELTSLVSRRSVYLLKEANDELSVVKFSDEDGNIKFLNYSHTWDKLTNKCKYCGVNKNIYDREDGYESYAYSFIHNENPQDFFDMKFDFIIGNPPYQMSDGGRPGDSAKPIYNLFGSNFAPLGA